MNDLPPIPDIVGEGEARCPTCGTRIAFPPDAPVSPYVSVSFSAICGCGLLIEVMQRPPESPA